SPVGPVRGLGRGGLSAPRSRGRRSRCPASPDRSRAKHATAPDHPAPSGPRRRTGQLRQRGLDPWVLAVRPVSVDPGSGTPLRGSVEGVVGLDTQPVAKAESIVSPASSIQKFFGASAPPTSELPFSGTASGCAGAIQRRGFTPNQYLTAYGYDSLRSRELEGQGEKLALVEIDGLKDSDLRTFATCFGLSRPAWTRYTVGGLRHPLAPGGE